MCVPKFVGEIQKLCVFCVQSDDVLCGTLHCDISAISDPQLVNFQTDWAFSSDWRFNGVVTCTIATYKTFYSGPNRTDPGLVPDGAACGTEKVTLLYNEKCSFRLLVLLRLSRRLPFGLICDTKGKNNLTTN